MAHLMRIPLTEELNKNPELKKEDIENLKEWYAKQSHLPKISDSDLALFLHANYYRMESAKANIDTFYTVRTHVPEFFNNRDPLGSKELRKIFKTIAIVTAKHYTSEGYMVIITKLVDTDPSKFVYNDSIKYLYMCMDLWIQNAGTTNGFVILVDFKDVSLGHAARLSPLGLKKFLYFLQEGLPIRLKAVHFINASPVMEIILNMMKPFMKKELLDMLQVHPTVHTVHKTVPLELLPKELGGTAGPIIEFRDALVKALEKHRDWFLSEELNFRVDECRRAGKGKSASDLFGVEGSFKKLDID